MKERMPRLENPSARTRRLVPVEILCRLRCVFNGRRPAAVPTVKRSESRYRHSLFTPTLITHLTNHVWLRLRCACLLQRKISENPKGQNPYYTVKAEPMLNFGSQQPTICAPSTLPCPCVLRRPRSFSLRWSAEARESGVAQHFRTAAAIVRSLLSPFSIAGLDVEISTVFTPGGLLVYRW